jgi:hypothetical protein
MSSACLAICVTLHKFYKENKCLFSVRNVAEALVNMDRPDEAIKLLGEAITFLQKTGTGTGSWSNFLRIQIQ